MKETNIVGTFADVGIWETETKNTEDTCLYVCPSIDIIAVNSSTAPLMTSGNTGGSHDPSSGGNSGHGSSGDGNEGGNNGHDPSTGEDIGDDNPAKGFDWDNDLTYYNSYKVL